MLLSTPIAILCIFKALSKFVIVRVGEMRLELICRVFIIVALKGFGRAVCNSLVNLFCVIFIFACVFNLQSRFVI